MNIVITVFVLAAGAAWAQTSADECCKCDGRNSQPAILDVICLTAQEMRAHVEHLEPLRPSGLGNGLKLAGTVVIEVRFGTSGNIDCVRVESGHPIAIAATMEAIKKWTFKPLISNGVARAGCGVITIRYRLRDHGSTTR